MHSNAGALNCYTGNQADATLCPDSKTCTQNCVFEGADAEYAAAYGVHTAGELTDEPAGAEKKGWCNAEKQRTEHTECLEVMTANNAAVDQLKFALDRLNKLCNPSQYQDSPD